MYYKHSDSSELVRVRHQPDTRLISHELGGKLALDFRKEGVSCEMELPVDRA